jgi:hypothetical protein
MNIIANESLIRRNGRIGQIASIVGLVVLAGGLIISFQSPEQFALSWGALLVGFILSQIGLYFGNRYGKHPRPDELLNTALKGLNRDYALFHYTSAVSHLLVGPAGIWVLLPRNQYGEVAYERGRWRQKGGGLGLLVRKFFAQEGIGRPDLELQGEIERLEKYFSKAIPGQNYPIQAALIFTNQAAEIINAENSPIPAIPGKKFKEFIRRQAKDKYFSIEKAKYIQTKLEEKN